MSTALLARGEWNRLRTTIEIQDQIDLRAKLAHEMVGDLYPSVLATEVVDLLDMRLEMAKGRIWVICIKYDYGVWDEAGYFRTLDAAKWWIDKKLRDDEKEWNNGRSAWDEPNDGPWIEYIPTKYYVAELGKSK